MADVSQQNKSELYFGALEQELNGRTEVRLTRFNSLTENRKDQEEQSDTKLDMLTQGRGKKSSEFLMDDIKAISASNLLKLQQEAMASKWPWANQGKQLVKGNLSQQLLYSNTCNNTNGLPSDDGSYEQFEVVWKDLSFVVNVSAYDKLINKLLRPISRTLKKSKSDEKSLSGSTGVGSSGRDLERNQDRWSDELYCSSQCVGDNNSSPDKRLIFENLNGYFKSSEITAILGPSGVGKTSLLNAVCGKSGNYSGSVQLMGGGSAMRGSKRRMRLSIIPQRDYLIENLTVRENLLYASKILNTQNGFDHEENILRVVKMLNLTNCFNSRTANISGGEYKRVSIAQELLRQPDILILDEPTSGLDSLNCKKLIKSLVQLKENSRMGYIKQIAIVMTIHQPDIEVYQMFDHVYCMARYGRVIYDGKPGDTMRVIREQVGSRLTGSDHHDTERLLESSSMIANPANLLIEIASEDLCGQEAIEDLARYQRNQFKLWLEQQPPVMVNSKSKDSLNQLMISQQSNTQKPFSIKLSPSSTGGSSQTNSSSTSTDSLHSSSKSHDKFAFGNGQSSSKPKSFVRDKRLLAKNDHSGKFWLHSSLLAKRAFTATIRDPLMSIVSLLFHLSIPFVMYTVYSPRIGKARGCPSIEREMDLLGMAHNRTIDKIYNLEDEVHTTFECSTMFFLTTYCFSMCALSIASLAFPMNMHVLLKEVRNGWYNLSSFVVAKTISSFPFEVLFPVASIVLIYLLLGFPSSYFEWRLIAIAIVMALVSMISYSQGLLFGAIFMDSLQTSIFIAICSTLPLVVLSGFTARISFMPRILQILSWFSIYRYSSDSINIIRFGYGICPCSRETNDYLQTQPSTFRDIPYNIKPLFNFYLTGTGRDATENNGSEQLVDKVYGVSYDFLLNNDERNNTLNAIENNEIDVFQKLAESVSRSFAFGQDLNNCSQIRSEILKKSGTPDDEFLPFLFAGLFGILILIKIILFLVVRYKIYSKI